MVHPVSDSTDRKDKISETKGVLPDIVNKSYQPSFPQASATRTGPFHKPRFRIAEHKRIGVELFDVIQERELPVAVGIDGICGQDKFLTVKHPLTDLQGVVVHRLGRTVIRKRKSVIIGIIDTFSSPGSGNDAVI